VPEAIDALVGLELFEDDFEGVADALRGLEEWWAQEHREFGQVRPPPSGSGCFYDLKILTKDCRRCLNVLAWGSAARSATGWNL